jgi:hypothetical protein
MKKYISILAVAIIALAGCKKGYLNLNENPNLPSSVPSASLVAAAEVKTAYIMVDPNLATINAWMDQWAYSPNYAVNQDTRDYKFTTTFAQGLFTDLYTNAFDYQKIIDFAIAQNNPALEGIGRTMKSLLMQYAVDVYNNVPYSTAFQGAVNKTPTYDDALTIYQSIYNDLNLAITKFNSPAAVFPTATQDIMFKGSQSKWVKFANTLKLRILLRQSARADRAAYITGKLATDFPAGLSSFLQAGEIATINPGYTNSDLKQNPYWSNFGYSASNAKTGNNDFFKAASYAVSFYTQQQDLRIFFTEKPAGTGSGVNTIFGYLFRGNDIGSQGSGSLTYSDNLDNSPVGGPVGGLFYRDPSFDQPIMTDFESLFLQAEAVQRGWFGGSAQALFNSAQLQSMIYMFDKVDGAGSGATYQTLLIPDARNNWALAPDKINLIITQKWASLNTLNFWEPWADYRRTGFPNVPLSVSLSRGPHIPYRLKYPQTEYDLNGANVSAQGSIDQFTSKIWWMP